MTSLRRAIKKLSLKPGDVLLVRDWTLTEHILGLELPEIEDVPIVEVERDGDLEVASEERMNALGWYRREGA